MRVPRGGGHTEFESHWVPHSYGLVPHLSQKTFVNPVTACSYLSIRGIKICLFIFLSDISNQLVYKSFIETDN